MSHEGCYTVYSAPSKSRGILGGIVVISTEKNLEIQGNVFNECTLDEAIQFLNKDDPTTNTGQQDTT